MSHCQKILDALRNGEWHTSADLYDAVGGYMVLHSRISDLRAKGHHVEGRHVPGQTGAQGYEYRLVENSTYIKVSPQPPEEAPDVHPDQLSLVPVGASHYDI